MKEAFIMVCEFCKWIDSFGFTCPVCLTDFDSKHRLMVHSEEFHKDYLEHMGLGVDCETCPDHVKKKSKKPKVEVEDEVDEEAKNLFGINKAVSDVRWVFCSGLF